MMSIQTIHDLQRKAAIRAYVEERLPYQPEGTDEIERWRSVPIPNLGDYRPAGWKLVGSAFVDKTGWGSPSEPAMTLTQFKRWVQAKLEADPTAGFGLIEEGQFQVYVGYFTQDETIEPDETDYLPTGQAITDHDVSYCEACGAVMDSEDTTCDTCGYDPDDDEDDDWDGCGEEDDDGDDSPVED